MPPSSDIILIGAGRSPLTKQRRTLNRFPQRNFYIGNIHIRTGMRFPVNEAFLKKHFSEIEKRVEAGTLIVEYKLDKFVDMEELKTLAFGSEEARKAYEEEATAALEERAAASQEASDKLRAEQEEAARLSVLGDLPVAKPGEDQIPVSEVEGDDTPGTTPNDNATRLTGGTLMQDHARLEAQKAERRERDTGDNADTSIDTSVSDQQDDNMQGSHEETFTSPRDLAQAAQEEVTAEQTSDAEQGSDDVEPEPEYRPDAALGSSSGERNDEQRTSDNPDFKPLPAGYHSAAKPELLALCEERGIDTSDMPSNKELRRRLDEYAERG